MTSAPGKLAEFAAPTRGRVKYAPLTAGLLARKGEAVPATPYFAAEALDLYTSGPIVVARHEPPASDSPAEAAPEPAAESPTPLRRPKPLGPDEARSAVSRAAMTSWRMRHPALGEPARKSDVRPASEIEPVAPASREPAAPSAMQSERLSVSFDLDLDLTARLARFAQRAKQPASRVVEEALRAHFAADRDICPSCAREIDAHNS